MAKAKEASPEDGAVQVTLPDGMTPEDFTNLLTKFAKKEETSKKDKSIVFKKIERGPDKEIRISRDTYKGRTYNSIREWYTDAESEELKPGRGVTFSYEDIDEITEGLAKLKEYLEEHPQEGED